MTSHEYNTQVALVNAIRAQYPKILMCASAGGKHGSLSQGSKMKATGYSAGFPDLFIYQAKGRYHGLAIELKHKADTGRVLSSLSTTERPVWSEGPITILRKPSGKPTQGKPTKEQLQWIERLKSEGYCAEICYGFDAAWKLVQEYMKLQPNNVNPISAK